MLKPLHPLVAMPSSIGRASSSFELASNGSKLKSIYQILTESCDLKARSVNTKPTQRVGAILYFLRDHELCAAATKYFPPWPSSTAPSRRIDLKLICCLALPHTLASSQNHVSAPEARFFAALNFAPPSLLPTIFPGSGFSFLTPLNLLHAHQTAG